nr:MAG: DUF1282 domain-containing protein [Hyphomicrobiales bacterium]
MRSSNFSLLTLLRLFSRPKSLFDDIAQGKWSAPAVFFGGSLWIALLPPVFAFVGASNFGWSFGTGAPLFLSTRELMSVSIGYYLALLFGFVSASIVSQWMAMTYGAQRALGAHFALITVAASPLALASIAHLYPQLMINFLVFVPALAWSLYLLYWGLPIALETNREQGMLMASSLVAYLLVAAVSLLGITVVLWTYGIGPRVWI